jgi:tetratricopeptide (TPR) repeat protein
MTVDGVVEQFWNMVADTRFIRAALAVLLASVVIAGGYGAYRWHISHREQKAQRSFAECLSALGGEPKDVAEWKRIAELFKARYDRHASSNLAPFFLVYASDAEHAAGDAAAAESLMIRAVDLLPESSPVYYLLASKRALMKSDSSDAATREQGVRELQDLAQLPRNPYKDIPLYYRGLAAYQKGDFDGAKASWMRLIREYGNDSLWSEPARTRLALLP